MDYRSLGRAGVVVAALSAGGAACGSRDKLFVLEDLPPGQGGTAGLAVAHAGSLSGAGHGGVGTAGSVGQGGVGNSGGFGNFGAVGNTGGFGNFGAVGNTGGAVSAFGGSNMGGASFGGELNCDECLARSSGDPCRSFGCDFSKQACVAYTQPDGTGCAPMNRCEGQRFCVSGMCVGGARLDCSMLDSPCNVGTCDRSTGLCTSQPVTGAACDDGDPCTASDQCVSGKCLPGKPTAVCQNNDKCCPSGCNAGTDNDCHTSQFVITASTRGWYANNGAHDPKNGNTFTGANLGSTYNSFFIFDLSTVKGTIVSAQLQVAQQRYFGMDASETVSIWNVSETSAVLATSTFDPSIFFDLQDGSEYGKFLVSPASTGSTQTTALGSDALADINAARGGSFSLGLHVDTISMPLGQQSEGVSFSEGQEPQQNQLLLTAQ